MRALAGFAVLLIACLGLAACGEDEPKSIQAISKDVFLVEEKGGRLLVGIRTIDTNKHRLFTAADIMVKAARFQLAHGSAETSGIEFQIWMPASDQYGNADAKRAMVISYPMADLQRVNWDGFTVWHMLNLGRLSLVTGLGSDMAINFCADKDNGQFARPFCLAVIAR